MIFSEEKLFSTGGVAFVTLLAFLNFDDFPNFYWTEFVAVLLGTAAIGAGVFYRQRQPTVAFYLWGLIPWSLLFLAYTYFTFGFIAKVASSTMLWGIGALWAAGAAALLRLALRLEDGPSTPRPMLMGAMAMLGAPLSGLLLVFITKDALVFAIGIAVNALIAFAMHAYVGLWIRRVQAMRSH